MTTSECAKFSKAGQASRDVLCGQVSNSCLIRKCAPLDQAMHLFILGNGIPVEASSQMDAGRG